MPEKLSIRKSLSIIRLYLNGLSYGEIAAKAGVGKETVANVIAGLNAGKLPEVGDAADQVEVLRELALDLKHCKLTPAQEWERWPKRVHSTSCNRLRRL